MSRKIVAGSSILVLVVGLFAAALVGPAWSENRGMLIRVRADEIVVNLGLQKNVRPGTQLYVYDSSGRPVATVRVREVDDYSSRVELVGLEPGGLLAVGNTVTDTPYKPAPVAARTPAPPPSPGATASPSAPRQSPTPQPSPTTAARTPDPVKGFVASLKGHTRMYQFKGGKGGAIRVKGADVYNILSTVLLTGSHSAALNPWMVTNTVMETYGTYSATSKANQRPRSYLEVVYWDRELMSAYADYYVYKQNLNRSTRDEVFRNLVAQKGVDTSVIFQIKVMNRGPGVMQLAPFDWHVYMMDPSGNRIKAERYDEILDKALNAGQEVAGYVYFPRRDPTGKSLVAKPVTLLIEGRVWRAHHHPLRRLLGRLIGSRSRPSLAWGDTRRSLGVSWEGEQGGGCITSAEPWPGCCVRLDRGWLKVLDCGRLIL